MKSGARATLDLTQILSFGRKRYDIMIVQLLRGCINQTFFKLNHENKVEKLKICLVR